MPSGVYVRTKKCNEAHKRPLRFCSIESCDEKHYCKGFCQKHYDKQQHRKYYLKNKKQMSIKNKQWRKDNKKHISEYRKKVKKQSAKRYKQWYQKNIKHKKKWYLNNKKEIAKKKKQYRQTPNGKLRQVAYRHNRRASTKDLNIATIQQVYEDNIKKFGTLTCCLCFKWITFGDDVLDHLTPLSREGTNDFSNLGVAHSSCNKRKFTMTLEEWRKLNKEKKYA